MSLFRCPVCTRRTGAKPVTVFWGWRDVEQRRHAYRQQLCVDCFQTQLSGVANTPTDAEVLTCPQCGIRTEEDYDACFANLFIPGYGRLDVEAPLCASCAAKLRMWVRE